MWSGQRVLVAAAVAGLWGYGLANMMNSRTPFVNHVLLDSHSEPRYGSMFEMEQVSRASCSPARESFHGCRPSTCQAMY